MRESVGEDDMQRPKAQPKRLTVAQKFAQLKRQTEQAGMRVSERSGRIVVTRTKRRG